MVMAKMSRVVSYAVASESGIVYVYRFPSPVARDTWVQLGRGRRAATQADTHVRNALSQARRRGLKTWERLAV